MTNPAIAISAIRTNASTSRQDGIVAAAARLPNAQAERPAQPGRSSLLLGC
jgi:hypothetical protein